MIINGRHYTAHYVVTFKSAKKELMAIFFVEAYDKLEALQMAHKLYLGPDPAITEVGRSSVRSSTPIEDIEETIKSKEAKDLADSIVSSEKHQKLAEAEEEKAEAKRKADEELQRYFAEAAKERTYLPPERLHQYD